MSIVTLVTTTGTITRTYDYSIATILPAVRAAITARGDVLRASITDSNGDRYNV